jgi:uncharacterized protein YndB with AHSA1/START domain
VPELLLTRRYDAPVDEVWAALTEPASVERWLAHVPRLELERGGVVELRFNPTTVTGRVREVEHERVLELEWNHPGEQPSVVRFELAPEGDATRLVLRHSELEERLGEGYGAGWTRHLERLERLL